MSHVSCLMSHVSWRHNKFHLLSIFSHLLVPLYSYFSKYWKNKVEQRRHFFRDYFSKLFFKVFFRSFFSKCFFEVIFRSCFSKSFFEVFFRRFQNLRIQLSYLVLHILFRHDDNNQTLVITFDPSIRLWWYFVVWKPQTYILTKKVIE